VNTVLSWSGGKDSALALWKMREAGAGPVALLTTINADHDRVSIHGVRRELVRAQAGALGLPLTEVEIPTGASNALYEERLAAAFVAPADAEHRAVAGGSASLAAADDARGANRNADPAAPLADVEVVAFADLFLVDIRAYREAQMEALGRATEFPLWGLDTAALAREFIDAGFGATLVAVDTEQLDASFCGRRFGASLLADLPAGVDPCGENGEFHTFVDSGPIFTAPIAVTPGESHDDGRFVYRDLLPG
jgi:uncharacterized protein (TIGR00290 family)